MGRDSLRTRWVRTEPAVYIQSEQSKINHRKHSKLKREREKELEQLRSWRETFGEVNPPILIYAPITMGHVPAGSPIQAPREFSHALIRVRGVAPVGDFNTVPVLVITEDELLEQDVEPTQETASVLIALRESANGIPAGVPIQVPRSFGTQFVDAGLASIVESELEPALVITERDLG